MYNFCISIPLGPIISFQESYGEKSFDDFNSTWSNYKSILTICFRNKNFISIPLGPIISSGKKFHKIRLYKFQFHLVQL